MSVKVSIHCADSNSEEYHAAQKMKEIIVNSVPDSASGDVVLFTNATLFGQTVKDIDLLMIGELRNYRIDISNSKKKVDGATTVEIRNFCTVIEVKKHDISGILRKGTDFYVKYGKKLHCVTLQSNRQKIAAKRFFESALSFSPFITNVIWFTQVLDEDIRKMLKTKSGEIPSNVIGADFDFTKFMQLLLMQKTPQKRNSKYIFESCQGECQIKKYKEALMIFSDTKEQMGSLTRKRIEMITQNAFRTNSLIDSNGKVSIYRGRAGTGKTVGLIQTAIKKVDEEQARVIILTYNLALVSDIRRLFALAELPDLFEEKCVHVSTMQSFFFDLANRILFDNRLKGDKFLEKYDSIVNELNEYLTDDVLFESALELMSQDDCLNWDYVLIDEAQDWSNNERDLILRLFDQGRIIIADGGNQFVRQGRTCDWNVVIDKHNIKLKYCLRQKENIISFINEYSNELGIIDNRIKSNGELLGGKVLITTDDNLFNVHKYEMNRLLEEENIPYDMLYLTPHSLVKKNCGDAEFKLTELFEKNGIHIWDGTNSLNRKTYSINADEIRVVQYDSARGLEGWTVVCLDFDVFIEEKKSEYIDGKVNSLLLESPEEKRRKYLYNWTMIPLTRAIDTLVITIKNPHSETANQLKSIATHCPDYVTWF